MWCCRRYCNYNRWTIRMTTMCLSNLVLIIALRIRVRCISLKLTCLRILYGNSMPCQKQPKRLGLTSCTVPATRHQFTVIFQWYLPCTTLYSWNHVTRRTSRCIRTWDGYTADWWCHVFFISADESLPSASLRRTISSTGWIFQNDEWRWYIMASMIGSDLLMMKKRNIRTICLKRASSFS